MQSFHQEFWVNPTPPTVATPFETTHAIPRVCAEHDVRPLTHVLSTNTVWDARVGRFALPPGERPEHRRPDDAEPNRSDHQRPERQRSADRRA